MAELDLVCGPSAPLPESEQSFRLIERLGAGGQADVYKAVRRSGGVSSAPVTLKVMRPDTDRPLDAQYRSWDKGDAVLMDLGGRGITGICRRINAFYGPPPHRPGEATNRKQVPCQVLEYLPGQDLCELMANPQRSAIDAVGVLRTVASVLNAMHRPGDPDHHPSLHMDIKPANVVVLPSGEARVIDFTGARYSSPTHMTSISFSPESAGPEARDGRVGPSYDVHGFGAVAFFLVTGVRPRSDSPQAVTSDADGWAQLRRHPIVEADPRLREHLLSPLSDAPRDRPPTSDLHRWIDQLAEIMRASNAPSLGVDWSGGQQLHARPTMQVPVQAYAAAGNPHAPAKTAPLPQTRRLGTEPSTSATAAVSPVSPGPPGPPAGSFGRGVAEPKHRDHDEPETLVSGPSNDDYPPEPGRPWFGKEGKLSQLTSGGEFSVVGLLFYFVCWGILTLATLRANFSIHILELTIWIILALGVFVVARSLGTLILVRWLGRKRRTARLSHLASGAFLVIMGIDMLGRVPFITDFINWISNIF